MFKYFSIIWSIFLIFFYFAELIGLSETWLNSNIIYENINVDVYVLVRNDRQGRGGGVRFFIRLALKFKTIAVEIKIEQLWTLMGICGKQYILGVIYRSSNVMEFIGELCMCLPMGSDFIYTGDFNIDLLQPDLHYAKYFNNFLSRLGLVQIINNSTRFTKTSQKLVDFIKLCNFVNEANIL